MVEKLSNIARFVRRDATTAKRLLTREPSRSITL